MQVYKKKSIILFAGCIAKEAASQFKIPKDKHVFITEGRPSLEAGRENVKIFLKLNVTPTVIADNMAGFLFANDFIDHIVLTYQYADKGGALCDMGALIYAVLAKRHKVPVKTVQGKIRSRFLGDPKSILSFEGHLMAPKSALGYVPLVEWVPSKYL